MDAGMGGVVAGCTWMPEQGGVVAGCTWTPKRAEWWLDVHWASPSGGGHDGTAPRVWVRVRRSVVAVSARVLRTGSGPDQWRDSGQGMHLGMGKKQAGASEPMPSTRTGPWSLRDLELTTLALKPQLWACDMPVKKKKNLGPDELCRSLPEVLCRQQSVWGSGRFLGEGWDTGMGSVLECPLDSWPFSSGSQVLPGLWAGCPPETSPTSFHLLCPGFLWLRRA